MLTITTIHSCCDFVFDNHNKNIASAIQDCVEFAQIFQTVMLCDVCHAVLLGDVCHAALLGDVCHASLLGDVYHAAL